MLESREEVTIMRGPPKNEQDQYFGRLILQAIPSTSDGITEDAMECFEDELGDQVLGIHQSGYVQVLHAERALLLPKVVAMVDFEDPHSRHVFGNLPLYFEGELNDAAYGLMKMKLIMSCPGVCHYWDENEDDRICFGEKSMYLEKVRMYWELKNISLLAYQKEHNQS